MDVGELVATLRLNLSQFNSQLKGAQGDLTSSMNQVSQSFQGASGSATRAMKEMASSTKTASGDMANAVRKGPKEAFEELDETAKRTTWNVRGYVKDTGRVITGILIAQGFYKVLSSIQDAIKGLFEFNNQLQISTIAFEKFLGSSGAAKGFLRELEDFSATTPFSFDTAQKAAMQLLNVGWAANKIIPTLRTVVDAASLRGASPDVIDGIVLALTQIANKGKVSAEELNQLADRGVPAYMILREQLNLSAKEMGNIGKAGIPANKAIDALLAGMDKFAGGTSEKVAMTTGGLANSIKDNLKIVGNEFFGGAFESVRLGLASVNTELTRLRTIGRAQGAGGIFNAIIPPNLQPAIRNIIGSIKILWGALVDITKAVWPLVSAFGAGFLGVLSMAYPILAMITQGIRDLIVWVMGATPQLQTLAAVIGGLVVAELAARGVMALTAAVRALMIAEVVATVVTKLKNAILLLSLAANPAYGAIMIIVSALTAVGLSSERASGWVKDLVNWLATLAGFKTGDILPSNIEDAAATVPEYVNQLGNLGAAYEDVGDKAKKAKKDTDWIAAFDEVFNMPDKSDDDGGGGGGGSGGLPPGGLGGGAAWQGPPLPSKNPSGGDSGFDFKIPPVIILPEIKWPNDGGPNAFATALQLSMNQMRQSVENFQTAIQPRLAQVNADLRTVGDTATAVQPRFAQAFNQMAQSPLVISSQIPLAWANTRVAYDSGHAINVPVITNAWNTFWDSLAVKPISTQIQANATWALTWQQLLQTQMVTAPLVQTNWDAFWTNVGVSMTPATAQIISNWATTWGSILATQNASSPAVELAWKSLMVQLPVSFNTAMAQILPQWKTFWDQILETTQTGQQQVQTSQERHAQQLEVLDTKSTALSERAWSSWSTEIQKTFNTSNSAIVKAAVQYTTDMQTTENKYRTEAQFAWDGHHQAVQSTTEDHKVKVTDTVTTLWDQLLGKDKTGTAESKGYWQTWADTLGITSIQASGGIRASWNTFWEDQKTNVPMVLGVLKTYWEENKTELITIAGLATGGISTSFAGLAGKIVPYFDDIILKLGPWANSMKTFASGLADDIGRAFQGVGGKVSDAISGAAGAAKTAGAEALQSLKNLIPKGNMPSMPSFSGPVPYTGFASGGLIDQDSIVRVGEKGRREAIIPLETSAMQPFADAIASAMGQVGMESSTSTSNVSLNVGVLVADRSGLKELERMLQEIRISESTRGSNT